MLYVRVDANEHIATGHLMRCLSIADAAKGLGVETTFIMADGGARELVQRKGHRLIVLDTPWDDLDREIGPITAVIEKERLSRLLVDTYQVTERYLAALSERVKVAYIDDLDQFHYPVDTLICYAAYAAKFDHPSKYKDTRLLLGTKYAPLRPEFCGLKEKAIGDGIERILVLSGGADPLNAMQMVLDVLAEHPAAHIDAICGMYNPNFDRLRQRYGSRKNISLHRSTEDIVSYMKSADLAVSAGGTTLYELCACGTPTISYAIADNQIDNVSWFDEEHIIECAGDVRAGDISGELRRLLSTYGDRTYRQNVSARMQTIVDGNGARRIVEHVLG